MINNVIAVKTHRTGSIDDGMFSRAMLIVRDPLEAARAEYNRKKTLSQTGFVTKEDFNKNGKCFGHTFLPMLVYNNHANLVNLDLWSKTGLIRI